MVKIDELPFRLIAINDWIVNHKLHIGIALVMTVRPNEDSGTIFFISDSGQPMDTRIGLYYLQKKAEKQIVPYDAGIVKAAIDYIFTGE